MKLIRERENISQIRYRKLIILIFGLSVLGSGLVITLIPAVADRKIAMVPIPFIFIVTGLLVIVLAIGGRLGMRYKEVAQVDYESSDYFSKENVDISIEDQEV